MRRVDQLIAGYLTLCLAFAGVIGLSPLLHQLIEHGGTGPVHTHTGGFAQVDEGASHGHFHLLHQHNNEPLLTPKREYKRPFAHEHDFELPRLPFGELFHFLAHLVERGTKGNASSESAPPHHHDSLPQLLLSGLLEQHLDSTQVQPVVYILARESSREIDLLLIKGWDAQMASRAPPVAQSRLV